jgi:hypothetical protein
LSADAKAKLSAKLKAIWAARKAAKKWSPVNFLHSLEF